MLEHIREKLQDSKSERTWKFLSAAAVTYDHCACVWGNLAWWGEIGRSDCVSVHAPALVAAAAVGLQWKADESGGGFTEMNHEADVQLMLQLCSKDSPAVPWISPCAYVIRIHGTAARAGASDPTNVQRDEMGRVKKQGQNITRANSGNPPCDVDDQNTETHFNPFVGGNIGIKCRAGFIA